MGRSGRTFKATAAWGQTYRVRPGVIDQNAKDLFSYGHCHSLALAVYKKTGFEIAGFLDKEFDIFHLFNITDKGKALDIEGLSDLSDYEKAAIENDEDFIGIARQINPDVVEKFGPKNDWIEIDLELAYMFVDSLLKSIDNE